MTKNIMIIIGLLLVVFSGCSNSDILIIDNNNINDLNASNYTTYSSNKINNLISNINVSGNSSGATYYAGTGLILTSTTFSLNNTYMQNFNETTYIQNNYPTFSFLSSNYYNKTTIDTKLDNISVSIINFNQTPSITCANATTGQMFYDTDNLALSYKVNGICLQIGEELYVSATNKLGFTILNGQAVYINGVQGSKTTVNLTNALYENTSYVLGLATEDILNNGQGKITTYGIVHDLNTSAWTEGTLLYISTESGNLTSIKPTAPLHGARVGVVLRQHLNQGAILVDVENGYELDELQNVYLNMSTLPINSYLKWNGTVWTNSTVDFSNYYTKSEVFNKTEIQDNYVYYSYLLSNYYNGSYINSYFYNKSYIDLTFLNYYTAVQISTNYYTKTNVYNKTESDGKYYLATNPSSYITSSALSPYALVTSLTSVNNSLNSEISARQSIGNWTLDKTSYSTTAVANGLYIPITYNSSLGKVGTCATGQVVQNVTSTGVQCVTDQTSAGGGYATVQEDGTPLTQRTTINFIGTGVTCVDNAGATKTDCTISSGGGSGDGTGGWVNSTYETETNLSVYQYGNNATNFKVSGTARSLANFEDFGLTVATYQRITTAPTIDLTETSQTGSLINFPSAATILSDGGYVMSGSTATNAAIINVSKIEKISTRAKFVATTNRGDIIGAFKSATTVVQTTALTGVFFIVQNSTASTTQYGMVCNTGACTNVTIGAIDTNWHEYTIVSNANLTNVATNFTFYKDGVNYGTIATNIPTTQVSTVGTWTEAKTAAAVTLRLDWYYFQIYR